MFLAFGFPKDETIIWARNLKAKEVAKIEAIQMPSVEYERYKNYDISGFVGIVEIINDARGNKIDNPEPLAGGALTFYITMKDGTRHTFSNNGNAYLVID